MSSAASRQRMLRVKLMQAEVDVLKHLDPALLPRYNALKRSRSARAIQQWYGKRKLLRKPQGGHENSLYLSGLPSTVRPDEDSEDSTASGLLELTTATADLGGMQAAPAVLMEPAVPGLTTLLNSTARSASAAAAAASLPQEEEEEAVAAAVEPSRLADLQSKMVARAARRSHAVRSSVPLGASSKSGGPSAGAAAPATTAATASTTFKGGLPAAVADELERIRDKSDALWYTYCKRMGAASAATVHSRRDRLVRKLHRRIARLCAPAMPAEVVTRAAVAPQGRYGNGAESDGGLRSSIDSFEPSALDRSVAAAAAGPLPAHYAKALAALQWNKLAPQQQTAAVAAHNACATALGPMRQWWQCYDVATGVNGDIRTQRCAWPWASDAPATSSAAEPSFPGQPGWKSVACHAHIPGAPRELTVAAHASATAAAGTADPLELVLGTATAATAPATSGAPAQQAGNPRPAAADSRLFGGPQPAPAADVSDAAASAWWLSLVTMPLPSYSRLPPHLLGEGAAATDSKWSYDCTLTAAQKLLGVIDPWSTAAALIDASAVSAQVRASAAATARVADDAVTAGGGAAAAAQVDAAVEDLLNLSMELAGAPAFDFYGTVTGSSAAATGGSSGVGSGLLVATPAFATPAESIAKRVQVAYEAVKRRVHAADDTTLEPDNLRQLTRDVAARRIARAWRSSRFIRLARADLYSRRDAAQRAAMQRLSLVQAAMAQFVSVLEATTGVEMGGAGLLLPGSAATALPFPAPAAAPLPPRHATALRSAADIQNQIGTFLSGALQTVNAKVAAAAHAGSSSGLSVAPALPAAARSSTSASASSKRPSTAASSPVPLRSPAGTFIPAGLGSPRLATAAPVASPAHKAVGGASGTSVPASRPSSAGFAASPAAPGSRVGTPLTGYLRYDDVTSPGLHASSASFAASSRPLSARQVQQATPAAALYTPPATPASYKPSGRADSSLKVAPFLASAVAAASTGLTDGDGDGDDAQPEELAVPVVEAVTSPAAQRLYGSGVHNLAASRYSAVRV